ncbi:MAG TPA: hypothetical protein V6C97_26245 [Oculatellaceae cyanobacterium]
MASIGRCVQVFSIMVAAYNLLPCLAQGPSTIPEKPTKIRNLFRMMGGQPRDARKVGLSFSSVCGVEIYYPKDWISHEHEELPPDWSLWLTKDGLSEMTHIHMEERPAYSLEQILSDDTEARKKEKQPGKVTEGVRKKIGDYKAVPALEATFAYGPDDSILRHVVYFGIPPRVHALVLQCQKDEYDAVKHDFEHILSTVSLHE